ncbi:MAG: ATP-binding protein [Gammaproteobacteria bacterium]|nr:ATP-binding protein [Gammaproteobacteria bacterium]
MKPYIHRLIEFVIRKHLQRGKSILLLGPRQTGKTTLIEQYIKPNISYSFAHVATRLRYEKNPALLEKELEEKLKNYSSPPVIFIDEVQKIPLVMDMAQVFIDKRQAQFILSGSSARKLKTGSEVNLLPGRVVSLHMTPLLYQELRSLNSSLESILLYGTLPNIVTEVDAASREMDLYSYVETYLEEEIRKEAMVRNLGHFSRFLQLAAGEAGKQLNFTRLSQDVGISDTTIANYYQILEDCLIVSRIDPIVNSMTKRRLIKSPKYLFFDLGVRRACANEGTQLPQKIIADLFEQFVGNELVYRSQQDFPEVKVRYWRDSAGPGIDYVLDVAQHYIPIEVKWSDKPNLSDARHILKFMEEYPQAQQGYIVCQTPHRYKIHDKILALPWQEIASIFQK